MQRSFWCSILASSVVTLVLVSLCFFGEKETTRLETAYERVVRTGVLRCGYILAPPFVALDPVSMKLGGMDIEIAEAMTSILGLKLDWQEVLMGDQVEPLRQNRIDAICAGEAPLMARQTLYLRYVRPVAFFPIYMYVRTNDRRFDGDKTTAFQTANRPSVKVAMMDGDISSDLAERLFPLAARHALPQTSDLAQLYMDVVTGKADFVLEDPFTASAFQQTNPGVLRAARMPQPFAIIPGQMSVLRGQDALGALLDDGIRLIQERGISAEILARYEQKYPNAILRQGNGF